MSELKLGGKGQKTRYENWRGFYPFGVVFTGTGLVLLLPNRLLSSPIKHTI